MKLLRGATGAALTLLAVLAVPQADAFSLRCRSDPAVILSDGTILDLSADINALLWDVTAVNYTVHVPAGLFAIAVVRTPNWPTTVESFTIVADGAAGRYDTSTVVLTRPQGVGVTAQLLVKTGLLRIGTASAAGQNGQQLRAGVTFR